MAIDGKVARILNERELIINKGAADGVALEMKFKVLEPFIKITDPDTGAELGTLEREKLRVKISEVQSKFSIGRTYETYEAPADLFTSGEFSSSGLIAGLGGRVTKVRTIRTGNLTALTTSEQSHDIKIGDVAIQIEGEV